jgi:hypothetical protein
MRFLAALWLSAPLVLLACSAAGGSEPPASSPPTPTASSSPTSTASSGAPDAGPVPPDLFNQIVADAARQAGVDPSALTVIEAQAVTWSDGSIGCPQPGVMYTQSLVEGYRVILEADGKQYDYHVGNRDNFILCPANRAKPPIGGE